MDRLLRHPWVVILSLVLSSSTGRGQDVLSPSEHLGRPVGADFELADWGEVSSYFQELAAASPRVQTQVVGTTTEGRDFLITVLSSESNLARLDEIRRLSWVISDPRRAAAEERQRAVAEGRLILMISNGMHSTETAAPQFGMELAYLLATSEDEPWKSARERLVVVMAPCTNPDGLDEVVSWYRRNLGTPFEASGLTRLYQLYSGHDNNRDWFALTQVETRLMTEQLYAVWRPQVYWDVHQQGQSRERMFVPPFRDPLNPNLDPAVVSAITALGTRALLDMTRAGYTGVSTGVSYDMWWNGGNRNVPVRHNMIGLLTEAASVNLASPLWLAPDELRPPAGLGQYAPSHRFPAPWPGGWWRLRDIIDYELAFARSLVSSLAREPELWLRTSLEAAERTATLDAGAAPLAWLIPAGNADRGAVRRLAEILLLSGVELEVAEEEASADGRVYPAGTLLIRREQPYSRHVKDLFEIQRYPEGEPPYDVAGWTLPLLFGVRRVEVFESLAGRFRGVSHAADAVAGFSSQSSAERLASWESDAWLELHRRLAGGEGFTWRSAGADAGFWTAGEPPEHPPDAIPVRRMPRVGLYAPWSGSMDEGWMRWVLDTWAVPYVSARNEMLRAGRLSDFLDVLVLPGVSERQLDQGRAPGTVDQRYAGGLDPEGAVAVEEFVRQGGVLIAADESSRWAVSLFDLPLRDVTRGDSAQGFSCPGSVLRTIPEEHALTAGLPASLPVFFDGSAAWAVDEERLKKSDRQKDQERAAPAAPPVEVLLRYAPTRVLLSGYLMKPETIAGQPAWLRLRHGRGTVHLLGFRPQHRGWSQAAFPLLFRAILLNPAAQT